LPRRGVSRAQGIVHARQHPQHHCFAAVTLIHCIYSSRASAQISDADIQSLLAASRRNNLRCGITGMLLFIEGSFFQVLEGDQASVEQVYGVIARDTRHDRVTRIISEPIAHRSFADWTMGFTSVARTDAQRLVGENDFFGTAACLERINPGRARKLLLAFGAGRWRTEHTGEHRVRARVG
jgi:hypothetical protein